MFSWKRVGIVKLLVFEMLSLLLLLLVVMPEEVS